MLRMIVMRHAKSSWKDPMLADHDRPLNQRGVLDCSKMAVRLLEHSHWKPTNIYSSTAKRARQTRELWDRTWVELGESSPECAHHPELYFGGPDAFLSLLENCIPKQLPMFVGHNPDIEDLLRELTNEELQITTANIALLQHSAESFQHAAHLQTWSLVELLRPRPPRS